MVHSKFPLLVLLSSALSLASGCVEDDDDFEYTSTGSGGYGSFGSSGGSCNLTELITDADRDAANAGGIQCSSQIANADVYYDAAVRACQTGETGTDPTTGATTTYEDTYDVYVEAANYALEVVDGLGCGAGNTGSGTGFDPDLAPDNYGVCAEVTDTQFAWQCIETTSQSCPSGYNLVSSGYSTSSECATAGDNWIDQQCAAAGGCQ